jgi:D-mannonate dehydratase
MLVNPFTERNLQLAAQVGVAEIVCQYPGRGLAPLLAARRMVEAAGMSLTILERKIPHLRFVHGLPGCDEEIDEFVDLIRNMAEAGMRVLCYNWMPAEDWQRTSCDIRDRGGSLVTEFNRADVGRNVTDADGRPPAITPARSTLSRCSGSSRPQGSRARCGPTTRRRWPARPTPRRATRCSAASSPPAISAA